MRMRRSEAFVINRSNQSTLPLWFLHQPWMSWLTGDFEKLLTDKVGSIMEQDTVRVTACTNATGYACAFPSSQKTPALAVM